MEDVRVIKQSVFRGVQRAVTFYSYNPPKTAQNWVNAEALKAQGFPALNVHDVKITMTRAMPANLLENAQMAQYAESAGAASTETKVRMLHAADNWTDEQVEAEVERIAEESRAQTPEIDAILNGSELETDDE